MISIKNEGGIKFMDNKITVKIENKKFEVLHFPRIKLTWYGEYLEIMALKSKQIKEKRKRKKKKDIISLPTEVYEKSNNPFYSSFKSTFEQIEKEQKEWNEKLRKDRQIGHLIKSASNMYKYVHANFYKYQGLHVVLTYSTLQFDDKEVYHDFKIFWQKLRYYYPNIGYISVLEPHQNGSWHIHLLLKDVTTKKLYISYDDIRSFWTHGFCYITRMNPYEDYGLYFKKKIKKDSELLKYYKEGVRYFRYSRNMKKPGELVLDEGSEIDIFDVLDKYKKINQYCLSIHSTDIYGVSCKINQVYYAKYKLMEACTKRDFQFALNNSYQKLLENRKTKYIENIDPDLSNDNK